MGVCLKLCVSIIMLSTQMPSFAPREVTPAQSEPSHKTADVCELLRDAHEFDHEEVLNEYANEYYDCHAHSRFDKLSAIAEKLNSQAS